MEKHIYESARYIEIGKRWLFEQGLIIDDNELQHFGILGMKWGIRRFQNKNGSLTPAGRKRRDSTNNKLSKESPKIIDSNGDYIYEKGTVVGRMGKQSLDEPYPMYLFTNEKDRRKYKKYLGGEEQAFIVKKSIKMPTKNKQIYELYKYTKDDDAINDSYYYWKDNINGDDITAAGFFKYMKEKGYDALIDIRNAGGVADDPILLLNPKEHLEEIQK